MKKLFARIAPPDYIDMEIYFDMKEEVSQGFLNVLGLDRYTASFLSPDWEKLSEKLSTAVYYLENLTENDVNFYSRARDVLDDYFPGWEGGKKKSSRLIHEWKEAIFDCNYKMQWDAACRLLTLWTGKKHVWREIRGCCQGDYAEIYFPTSGNGDKDDKYSEMISAYYFGSGVEVEIHDEDGEPEEADDVSGFWDYIPIPYATENEIKEYLAENFGDEETKPDDVTLFIPEEAHTVTTYSYRTA